VPAAGTVDSPEVQALLRRVGEFMAKYSVIDLSGTLAGTYVDRGILVVELGELLNFLSGRGVGLRRSEAMQVAAAFLYDPTPGRGGGHRARLVDLAKLQGAILEQKYADYKNWNG